MLNFATGSQLTAIENSAFANCYILDSIKIPNSVKSIGANAFQNCMGLGLVTFSDHLEYIGNSAFNNSGLASVQLPSSLVEIGANAFQNCTTFVEIRFDKNCKLSVIGNSAFEGCEKLGIMPIHFSVRTIGARAFYGCADLFTIVLPHTISYIGDYAFEGCNRLTFYIESVDSTSKWSANWYNDQRPIIFECKVDPDTLRVLSFEKSKFNPLNIDALSGVYNPRMKLIDDFEGWYTTENFSGTKYDNIRNAPEGMLYAKWKNADSCVTEGTLITLADGSQVAVENLNGDEQLLVWNMFTGKFDTAPILFIDSDPQREYEVINLHFSDGTSVKVISEHAFWDFNLNEYVFLRDDASKYIGHWFNKRQGENNWTKVQLTSVTLNKEITTAWSPVTYGHLCYYVNGMLSMPGATEGLINIFDVDPETLKIDEISFESEVEEYGLFTYDEFVQLLPVSQTIFTAFNCQYLKVAIGKGLITIDKLTQLFERYKGFLV